MAHNLIKNNETSKHGIKVEYISPVTTNLNIDGVPNTLTPTKDETNPNRL